VFIRMEVMEAELEDLWRLKEFAPDFRGFFSGKLHVLNSLMFLTVDFNGRVERRAEELCLFGCFTRRGCTSVPKNLGYFCKLVNHNNMNAKTEST